MGDHFRDMTRPKARKQHQCNACCAPIPVGEVHCQQTGHFDGRAFRNRFHAECWDALIDGGDFEFIPGDIEPPERLAAKVSA